MFSKPAQPSGRSARFVLVAIAAALAALVLPTASTAAQPAAAQPAASNAGGHHKHHHVVRNHCQRSAIDVPSCGVLWGMFRPKTRSRNHARWSPHYASVEKHMGRRFDLVKNYVDWRQYRTFPTQDEESLTRHGRTWYFSWDPLNYHTRQRISYAAIASGYWDKTVILPEARRLKAYHHKVFLDFSHEFDADAQNANGTPGQFVAAWRHIHDVFAQQGVHNVIWSWVSTGWIGNAAKIRAGWPGRKYVDWIGYDPYNLASCLGRPWRSSYYEFHQFYQWVNHQHVMRKKPMLISEYGSVAGPRVRQWYASIPQDLRRMPRIKALMQFSAPTTSGCDVSVPHSPAALAGFSHAAVAKRVIGKP